MSITSPNVNRRSSRPALCRGGAHNRGSSSSATADISRTSTRERFETSASIAATRPAYQDAQAAAELRSARREAAKVLKAHGVSGQIVVDASQPGPAPGVLESAGDSSRPASTSLAVPVPEAAVSRYGLARGTNEPGYVKLRLKRFRERVNKAGTR